MNRVIVITGAGGVLCSMFSRELAKDGDKIALLDINEDAAKKAADEICAAGGTAKAYRTDVLDRGSIAQTHERVLADFGACDILINGAGGNSPKCTAVHEEYTAGDESVKDVLTFFNLDEEGFRSVFDLNLLGSLMPAQEFSRDMLGRKGCSILNISSMNAYRPLTKIPAYSAAKAAVTNFTEWLAVYFAKTGIRVNAIAPGFFVTNQNRSLLFNDDGTPTARTEKILRSTPMGRFGDPAELIGAVRFLLDADAAGFVTGVVIPVDGGFSAYSGV